MISLEGLIYGSLVIKSLIVNVKPILYFIRIR